MIIILIEDLVILSKKGNSIAINKLITNFRPLILSMYKKYGFFEAFEDFYQNAVLILLEAVSEYEDTHNASFAYFYKNKLFYWCMENIKVDKDTKDRFQDMESLDKIGDVHYEDVDPHLQDLIWREKRESLIKALAELTPRQRWIIEEHFFKGKRLKMLEKEYGLHYQSLVKLKRRALEKLKSIVYRDAIN